jgi:hypothetical protein
LMMRTTWWWERLDDENDLMMRTTWWWKRLDDENDLMMRTIYLSTLNWADKEFFLIFLYIASLEQTWQNSSNINLRIELRALISSIRSDINPRVEFELLSEIQFYGQANIDVEISTFLNLQFVTFCVTRFYCVWSCDKPFILFVCVKYHVIEDVLHLTFCFPVSIISFHLWIILSELALQFICTWCRLRTFYLAIEESSNWTVLSKIDYNCFVDHTTLLRRVAELFTACINRAASTIYRSNTQHHFRLIICDVYRKSLFWV